MKTNVEKRVQDMTTGSVTGHLLRFSLPLLVGNMFQQLYNMVDTIVVGHFVGANALAAVGLVGSVTYLFFSLCVGLSGGIGVLVSQFFGAGKEDSVKETVANSIYITLAAGAFMSILSIILAEPILRLMNTPEENMKDALVYLVIVCGSTIVVAGYNTISSIMRALGDSKTPLIFLVISSLLNIGLDLLFVLGFSMGVAGVAWATVISQSVAAIGSIIYGYRTNPYLRLEKNDFNFNKTIVKKSMQIGIPLACQNAMSAVSAVASQTVINGFGSVVIAGDAVVKKVVAIMQQPFGVLGIACSNFSGQNAGAGKYDRVYESCKKGMLMVTIYSAVMAVVNQFFSDPIARIFVTDPQVVEIGSLGLKITVWMFIALGALYVMRASLNGVGDSAFTMINGIFEVIGSVVFVYILTSIPAFGMKGIWYTNGVVWTMVALANLARVVSGKWKKALVVSKTDMEK